MAKNKRTLQKVIGILGIFSVLCYVLHVILGGALWNHYNHLRQPISDLTASGAPNRSLLITITNLYGLAGLLFAVAFTMSDMGKTNKKVLWGSLCLSAMYLFSLLYPLFPEDLAGQQQTFKGLMHIVLTALLVPFTIAAPLLTGIGFLRMPGWKVLGRVSLAVSILIIIFGSASALAFATRFEYFGLVERMNIGILQSWVAFFSITILKKQDA